ncbi:TetR/AcrR family transcriptional regulator [Parvularcula flava]|uniref:TetR/AcrR family transcriptional regulator n=1 Tax=Aquisalinus luteolus TaxID=1566827 RepID=A0A8J3ES67_9PROT|nr:TetR/AcrR family transcriptional regulator [Aquisalinus luteolus]NHK29674.1 TetR/AcrR family transcriptional regulator [Aquisalinus luteolus]GGI02144.1 hypothetical protein GCM10011355_34450 [Aquisalinus luteolus]
MFSKSGRKKKDPVSGTMQDQRTRALYRQACGMLTEMDMDEMSIARLAKRAECSVGAFYGRFPDKTVFLDFVIRQTFRRLTGATEQFFESLERDVSLDSAVKKLIDHLVETFGESETAGVLRAATKLSMTNASTKQPLVDYRKFVEEKAAEILSNIPDTDIDSGETRSVMQITFATLLDIALNDAGPMRAGSGTLKSILSEFAVAQLDGASGRVESDSKADRKRAKSEQATIADKLGLKRRTVTKPETDKKKSNRNRLNRETENDKL